MSDYSSTQTRHQHSPPPLPHSSPPPNGKVQSFTLLSLTDSSLSSSPSLTTANPSSETSANSSTTKSGKSLNVAALAIGVTGAVLFLIVCVAIILYRRKNRRKVPPSAEFTDVAFIWRPRTYHEMSSPTSSMFTQKPPPYEPMRYTTPVSPFTPPPTTPPWSPRTK